jgi:FixJ family two-component response regulator
MGIPGKANIAVIDDDASLCNSLGRLLRLAGLHPVIYPSAEAFLGDIGHPRFDCLLLDVRLGGMSGLELLDTMNGIEARTPVFFISAFDDRETRERARSLGCAGFFAKTAPGAEIIAAIRGLVHGGLTGPDAGDRRTMRERVLPVATLDDTKPPEHAAKKPSAGQ